MESEDTSPLTARKAREVVTTSQVEATMEAEQGLPQNALTMAGLDIPSKPAGRNRRKIRLFI